MHVYMYVYVLVYVHMYLFCMNTVNFTNMMDLKHSLQIMAKYTIFFTASYMSI